MSIPVKLFFGKNGAKGLNVLIDYEIVDIPAQSIRAYADLRQTCAIKCNVSPAYLELFWLWDPAKRTWMDLQDEVDNSHVIKGQQIREKQNKCLEFRVRFVVRTKMKIDDEDRFAKRCSIGAEKRFLVYEDAVLRYLYRQKRNDFLSGKPWLSLESREKDFMAIANTALSISYWDLMCLSKILESEVQAVKKDISLNKLLPKYLHAEIKRRRFTTGLKVGAKFRHYITYYTSKVNEVDESRQTPEFFLKMYLVSLESAVPSYGVERYSLADGSAVTVGADSGITLQQGENEKQWCKFSQIADMTLSTEQHSEGQLCRHAVSVSKLNGTVKILEMKSRQDAVNLASCIDGYYRLLVDAHHYLCKEVSSPDLIDHLKQDCHGPIDRVFAERLLHERASEGLAGTGDYVLRRSDGVCGDGEYCANFVSSVSPLRLYQLEIKIKLGTESVSEVLGSVKVDTIICNQLQIMHINIPSTLQRIPPKARHSSNLIVQSCSQQAEASAAQSTDASERTLNLINFTDYPEVSFIETGRFTSVKRFRKRAGTEKSKYVVMKTLLFDSEEHQQNQHTRHIFDKSNSLLVDLSHQHIVRCVGVTLSNTVALEYAENGSITTYLKQRPRHQQSWLLRVLWQMAHAFHYLEERGFAHGNLCGRNVLLQTDYPQPHIRIADSGVTSMIANVSNNGRSKQIEEPVLVAPWLALEFCFIEDLEPRWGTYPTIEGDKWSFATTVCEILKSGNINVMPARGYDLKLQKHKVLRNFYKRGSITACLQPPESLTSNQELYTLISNCWSRNLGKRPYFQQILRELSVLLTNVTTEIPSEEQGDSNLAQESRDLSMYADEKLKNICDLGEGHFGKVGKFVYYKNRTERQTVAVKVLKKATIEQQKNFLREINTMTGLDHRYIVKIYGIAEPSGRIVMEFLEKGSLLSRLKKRTLRPDQLLQFSLQIAEGMLELEQRRIIHRDLAARNVLLVRDETGELYIKISDFGLARVLSNPSDCYIGISDEFPWRWYAPECLRSEHRQFTTRSDVWSYGVTLWEIFSHGKCPTYVTFRARDVRTICSEMYDYLTEPNDSNRLIKPTNCPSRVYDTMECCWETRPEDRITFREIQKNLTEMIIENS